MHELNVCCFCHVFVHLFRCSLSVQPATSPKEMEVELWKWFDSARGPDIIGVWAVESTFRYSWQRKWLLFNLLFLICSFIGFIVVFSCFYIALEVLEVYLYKYRSCCQLVHHTTSYINIHIPCTECPRLGGYYSRHLVIDCEVIRIDAGSCPSVRPRRYLG